MKHALLTVFAAAALVACKKNETTTMDTTTDTTMATDMDMDSTMGTDSLATSSTIMNVNLNDQDTDFLKKALIGGMYEVMAGDLAAVNGMNDKVKELGKTMVNDHTKVNDELKKWATAANVDIPTELDAEMQKKYNDLKAKTGADFDKAYAKMMVDDHKKDIELFKKQASAGGDQSLKTFASSTVPKLEDHLKKAEDAHNSVK